MKKVEITDYGAPEAVAHCIEAPDVGERGFVLRLEEIVERHSHAILIGRARAVQVNGGDPLVYSDGRYGTVAPFDHVGR